MFEHFQQPFPDYWVIMALVVLFFFLNGKGPTPRT